MWQVIGVMQLLQDEDLSKTLSKLPLIVLLVLKTLSAMLGRTLGIPADRASVLSHRILSVARKGNWPGVHRRQYAIASGIRWNQGGIFRPLLMIFLNRSPCLNSTT